MRPTATTSLYINTYLHPQRQRPLVNAHGLLLQPAREGLAEVQEAGAGETAPGGAQQSRKSREGVALFGIGQNLVWCDCGWGVLRHRQQGQG